MASEASFGAAAPQPKLNPNARIRPMLSTKQANTGYNDSGEQLEPSPPSSSDGGDNNNLTQQPTAMTNNLETSASSNDNNNAPKDPNPRIPAKVPHGPIIRAKFRRPCDDDTDESKETKNDISKDELIGLLSLLKSELQSKEMALAAIKCEQLKRLINPVEISRSSLAKTYMQLQDRLKTIDQNKGNRIIRKSSTEQTLSASTNEPVHYIEPQARNNDQTAQNALSTDRDDMESLNMLNTLLELLDRHPLLALPRDSIYCLDFNCNELSTKNYLNLKIQHLDNLINQHKRFRFYMNERLKRSEQRYLDVSRELELERNAKLEDDKSKGRLGSKSVLLKHIVQLKESLEKERASKQAIVMTLLNDLLDERERNESLKNQTSSLSKENNDLKTQLANLEIENTKLKTRVDLFTAKQSSNGSNTAKVASNMTVTPQRQQQPSATQQIDAQSSARSGTIKPTIPVKANSSPVSTNSTIKRSGDSASASTASNANTNVSSASPRSSVANSSRLVASSSTEHAPNRMQPLFKSASVVSPSQQVRGVSKSSSSGAATNLVIQNARGIQPVKKPQVPAKPAQLLDQQKSPSN